MKIEHWFTGIVEGDIKDPLDKNRVKVRMFGLHDFNDQNIKSVDLPWASVLLPTTSAASTQNVIIPGTCVFGFYRDGAEFQDAVIVGIFNGDWNKINIGGYNPATSPSSEVQNIPQPNSFAPVLSGASGVISESNGGAYVPKTRFHGSGPLTEFDASVPDLSAYNGSLSQKILSVANSQLNKNISYKGNASQISQYFAATTLKNGAADRQPWCAAFVCWVLKQTGIFDETSRPKTASAFGFEDWARSSLVRSRVALVSNPRTVEPGDLVIFSWSHIGIVSEVTGPGTFKSLDGNTSGATVAIRSRKISGVRSIIRIVV